jgi:hypothetical protein
MRQLDDIVEELIRFYLERHRTTTIENNVKLSSIKEIRIMQTFMPWVER